MATDKKSFILYCDLIHTIEKMPADKAGELFKHILRYVNDLNPETDDLIVCFFAFISNNFSIISTFSTFHIINFKLKRYITKYIKHSR